MRCLSTLCKDKPDFILVQGQFILLFQLVSTVFSHNFFEVNNSCHYGVISIDNTVDPYKAKDINNIYN